MSTKKRTSASHARKTVYKKGIFQSPVTAAALALAVLVVCGRGIEQRIQSSVLQGNATVTSVGFVASGDAAVRTARERKEPETPHGAATSIVMAIKIMEPGPTNGWYMPWAPMTLRAVATFSDGTTGDVRAKWTADEWYDGKEDAATIKGCEASTECNLKDKLRHGRYDIVASYDGVSSEKLHFGHVGSLAVSDQIPVYSDDIPEWAKTDIINAGRVGIMNGYADGRFGAADTVTNAQFAVLLMRIWHLDNHSRVSRTCPDGVSLPSGMTTDHFAYPAFCFFITKAYNMNWAFDLDAPITRLQAAHMISDVIGNSYFYEYYEWAERTVVWPGFTDVEETPDNARSLFYVVFKNIMKGDDTSFRPHDPMNRAEAAVIVMRTLKEMMYR